MKAKTLLQILLLTVLLCVNILHNTNKPIAMLIAIIGGITLGIKMRQFLDS